MKQKKTLFGYHTKWLDKCTKQKANSSGWKLSIERSSRKAARSKGLGCHSKEGNTMKARSMKNADCSKCIYTCSESIPEREGITSKNKTSESDRAFVSQHIESYPTVDFHYTRKDTYRKYLTQNQSIRRMYSLYAENDNLEAEGKLYNATKLKVLAYQKRKGIARLEKGKKIARINSTCYASTFDLQAVLKTPCSLIGELYYKRKLCCYKLFLYDLRNGDGSCYLWDETQGKRESCERVVIKKWNVIPFIPQSIEHATKITNVYVPSQFETVITLGRPFMDFKKYKNQTSDPQSIFVSQDFETRMVSNKSINNKNRSMKPPRQAFTDKLPISSLKNTDLLSLIASGTIPKEFKAYIQSLPNDTVTDNLPAPSVSDSDESD
ncbi:hypothetical protein MAR_018875 [Mya arenaria]|uniref:Uncharacterized protein n=1 Tax=Mya arenaria TaxID=6604 RepID=A0ABY7EFY4_MYAAR|nr:hypothetical protein MAR_018875 [Mya arenaria]